MNSGIYMIFNAVNDKIYIGKAIDLKRRLDFHKSRLLNGKHANRHLQRSFNKHGASNFIFAIIEQCPIDCLSKSELFLIDMAKSYDPKRGYNKTLGGDSGEIPNCETLIKMRHSQPTELHRSNALRYYENSVNRDLSRKINKEINSRPEVIKKHRTNSSAMWADEAKRKEMIESRKKSIPGRVKTFNANQNFKKSHLDSLLKIAIQTNDFTIMPKLNSSTKVVVCTSTKKQWNNFKWAAMELNLKSRTLFSYLNNESPNKTTLEWKK